ncbi:MAG: DUF4405 domain-containing protein, partial [Phycisphaerae bacterium]
LGLILFLAMVATGVILRDLLPPGSGGRNGCPPRLTLWGFGRHEWSETHFWLSLSLIGILVIHVGLHWSWVCETVRRTVHANVDGRLSGFARHAYGSAFLAALALAGYLFYYLADASVVSTAGG